MKAEENYSRCIRKAKGLDTAWQRRFARAGRKSAEGYWSSKIWRSCGSYWIRIQIQGECLSIDLGTDDSAEAISRARSLQKKLFDQGWRIGMREFEKEIAEGTVSQNSELAVVRPVESGWLSGILLNLAARIMGKVLAKVCASEKRLARIEGMLTRVVQGGGNHSIDRNLEAKIDAFSEVLVGFDRKLDGIQEWQCKFRPDAVWTLKEAAGELRKSEGKLLKCVSNGDIKTCPRKEGDGGQRGARGEPVLFLYEEIQRFKGYRK